MERQTSLDAGKECNVYRDGRGGGGGREGERADVRRAANVCDVCASLCCLHDVISCCFRVLFFNDVTQSVGLFSS